MQSLLITMLTACGGSSPEPVEVTSTTPTSVTPPTITPMSIGGKVIDGYIAGATVYLDINFNGKLDATEPSTTTDSEGSYVLDIVTEYESCVDYVPIITHVPVGAIDLDFPNTPITEAYDMVTAPQFTLTSDDNIINLTPLTTIVWTTVEQELKTASGELSCDAIVSNQNLRDDIVNRIASQEFRVANRYNITVESLYSDYVLDGNNSLHGLAQALVPGLKASYVDTLELESTNPSVFYKYVEFYLQLIDKNVFIYDEQNAYWMRKEFIMTSDFGYTSKSNYTSITNLMSYDLTTRGVTYERESNITTNQNDIEFERQVRLTPHEDWSPNNQVTGCNVKDRYATVINYREYAVSDHASPSDNATNLTWDDCNNIKNVEHSVEQGFIVTDLYTDGSNTPKNEVTLLFVEGNVNYIAEISGIGSDLSLISAGWIVDTLSFIDPDYSLEEGYGSDYWARINDQTIGSEHINKEHDSGDNYTVTTFYADGTHNKQCGTWSGGDASLVDCT